ncbi:pancreatic triacylglycerol lipase [Helicoverpa armigera]|uniref:pancreatic triacylglycerol lipase n=1 Tax=Helicoverpa armigera TaxID=29058 RepID=UPI0030827E25
MSRLVIISLVCLCTVAGLHGVSAEAEADSFKDRISKAFAKEVSAITDPLAKTIVGVGFSQCKFVKKLFGVDYDSISKSEPNLSELKLTFITREFNVTYLLGAAHSLVRAYWLNPRLPLKIYMHGFTDDPSKGSFSSLSQAFLKKGDFNIFALDASFHIRSLYLRSSTMVRFIGEELGKLLAALVQAGLNPSDIHLIGHSLGSHISGFAGKSFTALTGHRVGRITGLDPAGPCFSDVIETFRLNANDADFVDVIHSDAGVFGVSENVGHVDFYPNGGSQQPNCSPTDFSCSHSRAWLMFAESVVRPRAFVGVKCDSWNAFREGLCDYQDFSVMGYGARTGARGAYYLQTSDEEPYGRGDEGMRFINNDGLVKNLANAIGKAAG